MESRADTLVSDVTVIDAQMIENQSGRTLTEVISRLAGVQMVANGGRGNASSLLIRGTESRHLLLLIDGVRMGSATLGAPSLDNIALDSIERIEVLKGPASALYGSDAVGGVVQIFTKKGSKGFSPYVSVSLGNYGHREASAGARGGSDTVRFAVGANHTRESGYSSTNEHVPYDSFNADKDGYEQTSAYASVDVDLSAGWRLDAKLTAAKALSHWDNGAGNDNPSNDLNSQTISLGLQGQVLPNWTTRLRVGQNEDKLTSNSTWGNDHYNTRNTLLSWTHEVKSTLGTVLAGVEQQKDAVDSSTAYDVTKRSINAAFIGLTGQAGAHAWQLNARRDDNSQFGAATTGFAGYSYKFNPNWRVQGSYGTSFKAPSFNQLYYPKYGNPTTRPESGRNAELSVNYTQGMHDVKLTRFDHRIRGFITDFPVVTNVPRARIQGWTLAYQAELGNTQLHASLDLLDPQNVLTGKKLPRRADQQITLGIDSQVGNWTLGGDLVSVSKRFDDAANKIELAPFATLDLYANYRLGKDWLLQAKVNNVTNKQYELANGYNQPGRSLLVTFKYQPK
jgi:vitamin B12 transporter